METPQTTALTTPTHPNKCKRCEFLALDGYDFCAYHLREVRETANALLHNKRRLDMACGGKKKPTKGGKGGKGGGK